MTENKFSIRDTIRSAQRAEETGDLAAAANFYAMVVSRFPNHPVAAKRLKNLHKALTGSATLTQNNVNQLVVLLQTGDMENAAEMATRLICIAPKEAVLHNFQGIALSRTFETKRAEHAFRTAIKLRPNYTEALGNLGTLLSDTGKPDAARIVLEQALKLKPDFCEASNSMGVVLCQLGRQSEALKFLDNAIALKPDYVSAFNNKGLAYKDLNKLSLAIDAFEAGLRFDKSNIDILTNLGYAYSQADRELNAISTLKKVLKLAPDNAEVYLRLAVVQSTVGQLDLAKQNLLTAIEKDPTKAEAYRVLSALKTYERDDPEVNAMKRLFADPATDQYTQIHLGFALGKAFEDIQEHRKAFEYWATANLNRRQQFSYSINEDREFFAQIREIFNVELMASFKGQQSASNQPIFIVGMMRSGTTLVEQILSSHSQVFGAGELPFVNTYARNNFETLKSGGRIELDGFISGYLDCYREAAKQSPRVIDKLPINFLWVGLIKAAFPNARIINLVRDPRDVGLSIFKNYFDALGNKYAYDLEELAEFYLLYRQMMEFWHKVLPGAVYDISYEAIVDNVEGEARKLLEFCDLDWEGEVLNFHKAPRVVKTASLAQVREPIYASSKKKWPMFERELAPFIRILKENDALQNLRLS